MLASSVGAFLNAIINFLIVAFVLFVTIKAINMLHKKPVEEPKEPTTKKCPYCQSEIAIKAVRCPHCTSKLEGFPEAKLYIFPVFSPALSPLWTPPGLFCALFSGRRKENQNFFEKSIAFSGESWYYIRVVTTQQNMDG